MAAAVPWTLHNARIVLVSLGIGTIFFVLAFYGTKSGTPYRHRLPYDTIVAEAMKSINNTPDSAPTFKHIKDSNVFSVKVQTPGRLPTTNDTDIPPTRTLNRERTDTDWQTLDMSEKFDCDEQCQDTIQGMRQRGVANACALTSRIRKRPRLWDADGHLRADQMKRLNHLFPINRTKTIYCSVPKDGCSEWKRMILQVAGYNPDKYPTNIHPYFHSKFKALSTYNTTEAEEILKTYKKFVFVREPFQRMLSLFVDKALSKHDLPFNDTQFEQFLHFILKRPVNGRSVGYSEHWTHAAILCLPCDIQYSFIGRLETSKRDYSYIFEKFFHVDIKSMRKRKKSHSTHSSDPKIKEYYMKQVSLSMLKNIYKKYQLDYMMFSYSLPNFMGITKQRDHIAI